MAISITHAFVSGIADGADATVVRPSNWNAALVTSMATAKLLGRATAATGAFEEITLGTNLSFTGTTLNAASGSATWDTIGAAAGSNTTANGTNNIVYNTAPTADSKVAWTFGETTAATNGTSTSGVPNQVLLKLATLAASTQSPLSIYVRGSHFASVSPTAGQFLFGTPSNSTPHLANAASINTGINLVNGEVDFVVSGAKQASIVSGAFNVPDGAVSFPGIANNGSGGVSGFAFAVNDTIVVSNQTEKVRFTSTTVKFTAAGNFTANGATLWAVGSNSPGNAAVQEWLTIQNSSGTTRYIPCF